MVIIVHSLETKASIAANIGAKDYSYYFVLEKYRKVLSTFATVIEIRNPERDVDVIYHECQARDELCLFFSFTPPFKTATELQCPTICVFAWEYATVPTDTWGGDLRNDWRTVFSKYGCAVTHSNFSVRAVRQAMGKDFPVWSIPAPVWDDYIKLYKKGGTSAQSQVFDLSFKGVLLDFQGCDTPSASEESKTDFIEERSSQNDDAEITVHLKGIIYTTVFNPNDGRKNWMDLVWGFCWAFRNVEDVTLVMKLAYYDFEAIRAMVIHEIKKLAPFKCRVVALHGYLNDNDYAKLITGSTYIVNTAHGEGQCLPLMEYMSAGKPAVAPAHTAMEDYINNDNAFVVKSSMEWIHWPHDPRQALRTFRYRINWESLYNAYLESYHVAKNDPVRYSLMSACAVESLKKYCSEAVVKKRLKIVFRKHGLKNKDVLIFNLRKIWRLAFKSVQLLRTRHVNLLLSTRAFFRKAVNARSPRLHNFLRNGYVRLKKLFQKGDAFYRKTGVQEPHQEIDPNVSSHPEGPDTISVDASLSGWFKQETAELIEGFKILPEDVVLDAGCGDSPFSYFCAMQGAEVILTDIDAKKVLTMMERLKDSRASSVKAFVCDASSLPIRSVSVSKIIAMEILEHVDDPKTLLKDLVRVGKPGAQYLITVPDPVAETVQKDLLPPVYFEKPNHVRMIGRQEFEQLVMDAGLVVEQHKYYGFYWSIWWIFFWACKQDLCPPWHPLLQSWTETWKRLLETEQGPIIKKILDNFMPKSQAIIARKPSV